jgi:hypothetical protein
MNDHWIPIVYKFVLLRRMEIENTYFPIGMVLFWNYIGFVFYHICVLFLVHSKIAAHDPKWL